MVEIKAGIMVLEWAISHGVAEVRIDTDCLVFAQGLSSPESVPYSLQTTLLDFIFLCSLSVVEVVKVPRPLVRAAHVKARAALI